MQPIRRLRQVRFAARRLRALGREARATWHESELDVRRADKLEGQLRRIEDRLIAINRRMAIEGMTLEAPHDLTARRFRASSQNGEDGLTLALFTRIGFGAGTFVDIGCGVKGGNSAFFADEFGWGGLLVDGRPEVTKLGERYAPGRVHAVSAWVTRENVDELIQGAGLSGEIDLLSIDVDGVDYWLWDAISAVSPRVVICEYNSFFGATAAVTVPYDAKFDRHLDDARYYGVSLAGLVALGRRKGYRLVAVEPTGVNAYFLRDDIAPEIPGFESHDLFRRQVRHAALIRSGHFDMARYTPESGHPLIDVSGEWTDPPRLWSPS